jgi:hypothetical protein
MGNRTPTLGEVIADHVAVAMRRLRVAQPARIEKYDAAKRTADVTPLLKRPFVGSDGVLQWLSLPVIQGVPVATMNAGGHGIDVEIAASDVVLLVFADFSLDRWKSGAGKGDPVEPGILAAHAVADAIAIPCLWNPGAPPQTRVKVRRDGTVELGGGALQGVGLGNALRTELDAIWSALTAHIHGPGNTPAATGAATVAGFPIDETTLGGNLTVESASVKTAS